MPGVKFTKGTEGAADFPISWTLVNGEYGRPIEISSFPDKTVHIYGTFGSGGSVTIYGSNNPVDAVGEGVDPASGTWVALVDPQGNAITKTAAAIEQVLENPKYITAKVTAGDGTTSLTISINASRSY